MPESNRPLDFIAIGRAAVDLYGEQVGGRLEDMSSFAKYVGGCPANISIGAARLGLRPAMITRVGDEHMGRFVRETLAAEGVDVSHVATDPRRLTGLVILGIRDRETFPLIFFRENCADMAIESGDMDGAFIAQAAALVVTGTHFSTVTTNTASHTAIRLAKSNGTKVVLDIDYRPNLWGLAGHGLGESRFIASDSVSTHLQAIVPHCDLIVGTEEEIHIAGGLTDTSRALRRLRALSKAAIVMKQGPMGCTVFDGAIPDRLEDGVRAPGFPVEVFNVLGAGDAFMAGLLRGWLRGADWTEACRLANACGALVVSRHGCAPAMPSWTELTDFLVRADRHALPRQLNRDQRLARLHRVSTGRRVQPRLLAVGIDHRAPFLDLAKKFRRDEATIGQFKMLLGRAVAQVAMQEPHLGLIVDDVHGRDALFAAATQGVWLARPVPERGAEPLTLALGQWPATHHAKYVAHGPIGEGQVDAITTAYDASVATSREFLLVVPDPVEPGPAEGETLDLIGRLQRRDVFPDWWAFPGTLPPKTWQALADQIRAHDPYCRGLLCLLNDASGPATPEAFASDEPLLRGFAVGRGLFWTVAERWFEGAISQDAAIDEVAQRLRWLVTRWKER
ncbi:MAG: 5-dehydro-2-deoxygluconokinase [Alphaproteobacteria bacterium]|nr:5-dehydro-2-deoxygluconokinase [Alphaproteobacteria bacterium]